MRAGERNREGERERYNKYNSETAMSEDKKKSQRKRRDWVGKKTRKKD